MFIVKCQPWSLTSELEYGVSSKTVVIIDEQLRRWEVGTYSQDEIESALNLAGENTNTIMKTLVDSCDATGCIRDNNHSVTGVGIIPESEGVANRLHAVRSIRAHNLSDDVIQKYIEIATILNMNRRKFVIRQGNNYSILTDRTSWDMPNRCVMLDGSARYTPSRVGRFQTA
jgi:hypothetical protein